jgi:hypothetical protein
MLVISLICLLSVGVALLRRYAQAAPADPDTLDAAAVRDDVPGRLLGWAVGMLPAQRDEWGQAMLGELDYIDGRGQRWRFAVDCAAAALLLPPWGRRAAAAVWTMGAVVAGSVCLYAFAGVRYELGTADWVFAAIALVLLVSYALAASVLLRQPDVALPGLLGGLLIAPIWLAPSGFTFYGYLAVVPSIWAPLTQIFVVPVLVGVAGTLWRGSAAAGRRIARLAAFSAALYVFLYGTLAVTVIGFGGPPGDPGCTGSCNVGDRLGNNTVFDLWLLPLTTAVLGWAAAAATARIRQGPAVTMAAVPVTAAGPAAEPMMPAPAPDEPGRTARVSRAAQVSRAARVSRAR